MATRLLWSHLLLRNDRVLSRLPVVGSEDGAEATAKSGGPLFRLLRYSGLDSVIVEAFVRPSLPNCRLNNRSSE